MGALVTTGHLKWLIHAALFAVGQYVVGHTPQIMALVPSSIQSVVTPLLSLIGAMYFYAKQSPLPPK